MQVVTGLYEVLLPTAVTQICYGLQETITLFGRSLWYIACFGTIPLDECYNHSLLYK